MKKCPFCAEDIQDAAIKCRYCLSSLLEKPSATIVEPLPPQLDAESTESEKIYYSDDRITVTSTRVIFPNHTYAVANITAVSVVEKDSNMGCGAACLFFGLPLCMAFLGGPIFTGIVGVVLVVAAVILFSMNNKISSVRIQTAEGWNEVVDSDKQYLHMVAAAIEQAIIDRK